MEITIVNSGRQSQESKISSDITWCSSPLNIIIGSPEGKHFYVLLELFHLNYSIIPEQQSGSDEYRICLEGRRLRFDPGGWEDLLEKIKATHSSFSCLENFIHRGHVSPTSLHGVAESDTTVDE